MDNLKKQLVGYYINKDERTLKENWDELVKIVEITDKDSVLKVVGFEDLERMIITRGVVEDTYAVDLIKKQYHKISAQTEMKLYSMILRNIWIKEEDRGFLDEFKELIFKERVKRFHYMQKNTIEFNLMKVRYIVDRLYHGEEREQINKLLYREFLRGIDIKVEQLSEELENYRNIDNEDGYLYDFRLSATIRLERYIKELMQKKNHGGVYLKRSNKLTEREFKKYMDDQVNKGELQTTNKYYRTFLKELKR